MQFLQQIRLKLAWVAKTLLITKSLRVQFNNIRVKGAMRRAIGVVDRSDLCASWLAILFACELIIVILTNQGKTENS
jgi:hypothetical protein